MSTHRSRLEAGVHPRTDPRRGPELRAELERLAATLTPRWRPTRGPEDFGYALLRIGARLAEQSTVRLDDSARRDALAFFDFLGLPPGSPRSATGVLVMALNPGHVTGVQAPARTQVAVTTPDDGQETFETRSTIRLVPGGIAELFGVDPTEDRIDRAPAQVTSVVPPPGRPDDYRLVTFTGSGSRTLQLSPAAGLEEHDLLEIEHPQPEATRAIYQVQQADQKTGLVTLVDALGHPAPAGAIARRVTAFRAFRLPDVQRHAWYIGHRELLNLEQPARITLDLSPASVAGELAALQIQYSLYGTSGQGEPDWHPLQTLGVSGSAIELAKTWSGSVDETEVSGKKSRWIRARLLEPVRGRASATTRVSDVHLTVASVQGAVGPVDAAPDQGLDQGPVQAPAPASDAPAPEPIEGSRTVVQAAHNATPLATTRRFYPFGPEPIRFDTFALAAPEALSKKGAGVRLDIALADSSMEAFGVAVTATRMPWHGYGVGLNGYLQAILRDGHGSRWTETRVVTEDAGQVLLGRMPPVAVGVTSDSDVVVVQDRDGRLWSGVVQHAGSPPAVRLVRTWNPIDRATATAGSGQSLGHPVVAPAPESMEGVSAVLLDLKDGAVHCCRVDAEGKPGAESWTALTPDRGTSTPALSTPGQLTAIQGAEWPRRPQALELLARDDDRAVWIGTVTDGPGPEDLIVSWTLLEETAAGAGPVAIPSRRDVVPTATRFETGDGENRVWVCFATDDRGICGLDVAQNGDSFEVRSIERDKGVAVGANSALHTHPEIRGAFGLPAVVGPGPDRAHLFIWQWADTARTVALPGQSTSNSPRLVRRSFEEDPAHEILVPTSGERLLRAQLNPDRIEYSLRDHVVMRSKGRWAPHRLFIARDFDQPDTSRMVDLKGKKPNIFTQDGEERIRVFEVDSDPQRIADGEKFRFVQLVKEEPTEDGPVRSFAGSFADVQQPTPPPDGPDPTPPPEGEDPTEPSGPTETEPKPRTQLWLAQDDDKTNDGSQIVIGQAVYDVTAITNIEGDTEDTETDDTETEDTVPPRRIATLHVPVVADEEPVYHVVRHATEPEDVTAAHRGTLAALQTSRVSSTLRFPEDASPRVQTVLRTRIGRRQSWAQLADAWQTQPADGTIEAAAERIGWNETVRVRDYRNPELSWEYFDGESWQRLATEFSDGTEHLSTSGAIRFTVPRDLSVTEVGGKEDYWIRARLIGGDYGRPVYRVTTTEQPADAETAEGAEEVVTTQSIAVDTSELNPPEILSIEASFSGPPRALPEVVLVENNADVLDQTQAAVVLSASFELFQGAAALDPLAPGSGRAVIAGLSGDVGAGPMTLFVDADDQPSSGTLQVEVLMPEGWRRVAVDDRTASLHRRGLIGVSFDTAPVPLRLFGRDRVWLRFRPGAGSPSAAGGGGTAGGPWVPVVHTLLPNAVSVSHARTMGNEILGTSLGAPNTTVYLPSAPVLPDSLELRVREELSEEERAALETGHRADLGRRAGASRPDAVSALDGVPGTWVLWHRVDSLIGQGRDARVYVLESRTGRVTFGDDVTGRIPPTGRNGIRCFTYQQGGGVHGNVPAWSETKLTSAVEGVQSAVLPIGTAGGADSPPPDALFATAPHQLRHTGRALTPADIEALAVASSGQILRARCRRPGAPGEPLRLAVMVRDQGSRRPEPTHVQREAVAAAIREVGWGGLDRDAVQVSGPTYVPVTVSVHLIAPAESWADVEHAARDRLVGLFDPARGGPQGTGWAFGRRPATADLLRVLHQVPGIDRIAAVEITGLGEPPADPMPTDGMVCAEVEDIVVTVSGEGGAS